MTNPCQAIACDRIAHGQQGIWCPTHRKMVPADLARRIFNAWAGGSGNQPEVIEEAKLVIAEKEKDNVIPIQEKEPAT